MKQAIAGVVPAEAEEATVMVVWPSIASFSLGKSIGRWCSIQWPGIYIFRLGNLFALLSIPVAVLLYFYRLRPKSAERYSLTNRRIVIQKGLSPTDDHSIGLDEFDSIDIDVHPGQEWLHAGDLVLKQADAEVLRLAGVQRPAAFRQCCLKAHMTFVGIQEVKRQAAGA
jgi:hypothetical protein